MLLKTNYDTNMTLREAKDILNENYVKGLLCPCCKGVVKQYRRSIYGKMAVALIKLYQFTNGDPAMFVHINDLGLTSGGADFAKFVFWGLIWEQPKKDNLDKRTSGVWAITAKGVSFVTRKLRVPKYAHVVMGELTAHSGASVDIVDVLGKHFSYAEIMSDFTI